MEFFEDFEDFENGSSMDDDSFADDLEEDLEMDEPCVDDVELEDNTDQTESPGDEFTVKDAFVIGGSILWDLEEEQKEERLHRKRRKFRDDLE